MRIGLSTAAWYGVHETEDAAARLQEYQVPCGEVFLETYSEYCREFGRIVREKLGAVQAVSMHTKTQHFEGDLIGQSARQRQDAFDLLTRALDAGAEMGVGVYVYHGLAPARNFVPNIAAWAEHLNHARALAAQRSIAFCWETVSWCCLNSPERVRDAREALPDMTFVLDVKQALETGYDPLDYLQAMGRQLRHVHVLDYAQDGSRALPGEGCYDFPKLARALCAQDYAGDVILEPYAYMIKDAAALTRSLEYLRKVFVGTV